MAAHHGRIRFLFISEGAQQWGSFNGDDNTVTIRTRPGPADEDLIDLAAFQTLKHAGAIYVLKPEEMPVKEPVSAIQRF